MDEDARLMMKVRDGDEAAFDLLMNRHKKPLLNFIYRMVPVASLAEELAQDVFVRVYLARKSYAPTAKFSTWLFQIASNTTRKHIRKNRHFVLESELTRDSEGSTPSFRQPAAAADAFEVLASRERGEMVRRALAALPAKEKMALTLRKHQECSYQEIAQIMKCSVGAIKTYLHRGKSRMREALVAMERRWEPATPER